MSECRQRANKCEPKRVFKNVCVSVASASNGAMDWAWGGVGKEEDNKAMEKCRNNRGRNCKVAVRFCTGDHDND